MGLFFERLQAGMPANRCILGNGERGLRKRHAEKGMCIPASSKRVHIVSSARIVKSITSLCGCQVDMTLAKYKLYVRKSSL